VSVRQFVCSREHLELQQITHTWTSDVVLAQGELNKARLSSTGHYLRESTASGRRVDVARLLSSALLVQVVTADVDDAAVQVSCVCHLTQAVVVKQAAATTSDRHRHTRRPEPNVKPTMPLSSLCRALAAEIRYTTLRMLLCRLLWFC